jgi:hypothetical protein
MNVRGVRFLASDEYPMIIELITDCGKTYLDFDSKNSSLVMAYEILKKWRFLT